jgi:hypothetical protein
VTASRGANPPRLRVGLLVDSLTQPSWIHRIVEDIRSSEVAEIVLVVENHTPENGAGLLRKLWKNRFYLLYSLYSRFDGLLFKVETDAFRRIPMDDLLQDIPVIHVCPVKKKYSDYFPEPELARIRQYRLDVALRFGFRILRGDVLKVAKHGVWSYHHGDNLTVRGGPPGFWEVMEGRPVTGSILQVLTEELDGGKVIYRSFARTNQRSVRRNKNNYYWKSSSFVLRKLKELREEGRVCLNGPGREPDYSPYSARLYRKPRNLDLLPSLSRFCVRTLYQKLVEVIPKKSWFIAFKFDRKYCPATTFYDFQKIIPPGDRYWADPFPIKHRDKHFIFIEEYIFRKQKAHIALIELDADNGYRGPFPVLEKKYHLSYPFVFQWDDTYYMIPETAKNRTVELYRCRSFPDEWELEAVLLEKVKAVDATLTQIDDLWWMFVNIDAEGTSHAFDELHLYWANSPLGPWKPHKRNPVKSDCRSARPAGNLFWQRGRLYRPAQDCSRRYGYAISVNKIDEIDLTTFRETEQAKILPEWSKDLIGMHTINSAGELTVVDGLARTMKRAGMGGRRLHPRLD